MTTNFSYVGCSNTYIFNNDEKCMYKLDKINNSSKYYHCIKAGCKARGIVTNNLFQTRDVLHCHTDDHRHKHELDAAYAKMKRVVVTETRRDIRDIYDEIHRSLSFEVCGDLQWTHVRQTLQRLRRSLLPACTDLSTMIQLFENNQITDVFGKIRNTEFYQGALFYKEETAIIFANMELITKIPERFELYCDGTFSVTPFKAAQLLIIMANLGDKPRPICYVIMTNQRMFLYKKVFEFLKNGVLSSDGILRYPVLGMSDYEKPMRNALLKVWPSLELRGCMFHYNQALVRRAKLLSLLSVQISTHSMHYQCLKMLRRLCLLPIDRVEFAYEQLKEYIESNPQVSSDFKEFLDYFEYTWFGLYKPEEWVVGDLTFRCNNHLEGFNRSIKSKMPRNPSPYKFLDVLLDLAYDSSASYQSFVSGRAHQQINRSYITVPFQVALRKLENCEITEWEFLQLMAQQSFEDD